MNNVIQTGISIIVCTYNGADRLPKTLAHIARQNVPENLSIELIIVNNNSTDDTVLVANKVWVAQDAPFALIMLDEPRPGKGYAIETGYDAARYSYIITVDDDNWLEENYVRRAYALIHQNPDIGLANGKGIAVFEKEQPDWFAAYAKSYALGCPLPETGYYPVNKKLV